MLGVTFFGMFLGDWFNKHPQFEIMFVYVRDVLNFLGIRMVREHCFIPELATELGRLAQNGQTSVTIGHALKLSRLLLEAKMDC